jgi:hypothetical protein
MLTSIPKAPETVMVYFPREQCEIIDTWDVMGMCRFSKPRDPFLTIFSKPFPPLE